MSHLDPEVAALLAMGEQASDEDRRHLDACADCAAEVASFARAVLAGRATGEGEALLTPPDRVWESIRSELSLPDDTAEPAAHPREASVAAPARPHVAPRRRRMSRRPVFFVLAGAVAAVVAIVTAVWASGGIVPRPQVISEARLDGFPSWSGAVGEALLERVDGHDRVSVDLDASVPDDGYREVWLLTGDASDLVSLGILDGSSGTFDIPDDIDLSKFTVVDISQENVDGDPGHSGDSIVRGTLSAP
ncbi:anti-sigma factor [Microbacterium sp. 77mftsu3.1]|uniref:anti-sigma factor n=1 Tax=Microbacterium sp. 77mftsu3.1 TaxID=1761802 RepID=UPI00036352D1|nr:anti-sigma factor [Microbacterium sp. 77mftsu3.1]SDG20587.1 Anti-sigma-K factor rskA [Microbacterium sp. 77mftsu3.1]